MTSIGRPRQRCCQDVRLRLNEESLVKRKGHNHYPLYVVSPWDVSAQEGRFDGQKMVELFPNAHLEKCKAHIHWNDKVYYACL